MKIHTTNYHNTLVEIAEDCPTIQGIEPPLRGGKPTVASLQYEMVINDPYRYNSDEVLFGVFAKRKGFEGTEWVEQRQLYFSKGQPCFRASPLTKKYGWGVHSDKDGKIALYSADSDKYLTLQEDPGIVKVKAMRSSRK